MTCSSGKISYASRLSALIKTASVPWPHTAYRCPVCGRWHTRNDAKRRTKRAAA